MAIHLQIEVEKLKHQILELGSLVEEHLQLALRSVEENSEEQARQVIDGDDKIDEREIEVEEECLKILALHQPVAVDLRYLIAVLKINNELERIGDMSVNIAERSLALHQGPRVNAPFDVHKMGERVGVMLKLSLDSLIRYDEKLAHEVQRIDDEVDQMNRQTYETVKRMIREDINNLESMTHFLSISRNLERIADHAENIAEDVLYMIEGEIVRHKV